MHSFGSSSINHASSTSTKNHKLPENYNDTNKTNTTSMASRQLQDAIDPSPKWRPKFYISQN